MTKTKTKTAEYSREVRDALFSGHETPEKIFGKDGLFKRLQSALIEHTLGGELTHQPRYPHHGTAAGDDRRNGHGAKTLETESDPLSVRVPRDRDGALPPSWSRRASGAWVSTVTDAVMEEVRSWQNRPLESHYPIVHLDALRVKVHDRATL